jgi:hypothetical protein
MKTLSLVNLYKAEIKKNMLAQIKGGGDIKCICSTTNPHASIRQSGGPVGDLCVCGDSSTTSASVQDRPSER